jgi:polysaccharide lyase-like protein
MPGGDAPFQQDHGISGSNTEFYGAIWVKFSSNFVGQSSGVNKIFFIWTDDNGGTPSYYLSAQAVGASDFQPQIRTQDNGAQDLTPNVSGQTGYTFARNTWVRWEFYIKNNTPGNSDGIVRVWMNGTKVTEYDNIKISASSTQAHLTDFQFAPYWGGIGGTLSAPQYMWIDQSFGAVR